MSVWKQITIYIIGAAVLGGILYYAHYSNEKAKKDYWHKMDEDSKRNVQQEMISVQRLADSIYHDSHRRVMERVIDSLATHH